MTKAVPISGSRWRRPRPRWLVLTLACALLAAAFFLAGGKRDQVRVQFVRRTVTEDKVFFMRLLATNAGTRPVVIGSLNAEVRLNGLWLALCRDYTIGLTLLPGQSTTFTVPALNQGEAFRGTVMTGFGYGRLETFLHRAEAKARSFLGKPVRPRPPFAYRQTNTVPEFSVSTP